MKSNNRIPEHIAIIMDGNGRWAKKRLLPRNLGHNEGVKTINRMSEIIFDRGVKHLTLFAFSTENWKRPEDEISGLIKLLRKYIKVNLPKMIERKTALRFYGDFSVLDEETNLLIKDAIKKTGMFPEHVLGICFNYGGRAEIVKAASELVADGKPITEQSLTEHMYTAGISDPDIIIRTGGENRISNFMLYQMAYSEIYFIDTLWPDFSEKDLDLILEKYAKTERRYGSIKV